MNILHVTQNYYPSFGGTQHTMRKVSEYLHENFNDEVTVYTTNSLYGPNNAAFEKIEKREENINGVHVKRFGFVRMHKPFIKYLSKASVKLSGKSLPFYFTDLGMGPVSASLKQALLTTGADVICASSVHYRFADYGIIRKNIKDPKPFVLYGALHLASGDIPVKYLERIQASDQYIANSEFEKNYLINKGVHEEKITVAGAATDILSYVKGMHVNENALRVKYKLAAGDKTIVYIGRQETYKSIDVLIKAFLQLKNAGERVKLVIEGAKGSYSETLAAITEREKNILVLADISNEDKCSFLQVADVVVLPSKEESFGVVFLEAWSFKKPVIGAAIGAIASIVDDGKDGYLFDPDNADDLADKIKNILDNPQQASAMGNEGYKKVQSLYTWDKIAATFREAYCAAIKFFESDH